MQEINEWIQWQRIQSVGKDWENWTNIGRFWAYECCFCIQGINLINYDKCGDCLDRSIKCFELGIRWFGETGVIMFEWKSNYKIKWIEKLCLAEIIVYFPQFYYENRGIRHSS